MCKFGDAKHVTPLSHTILSTDTIDEDYGFFDQEEIQLTNSIKSENTEDQLTDSTTDFYESESTSDIDTPADFFQCFGLGKKTNSSTVNFRAVAENNSPTCCRVFPDGERMLISLTGFQIVNNNIGSFAEYQILLQFKEIKYKAWRKFSEFKWLYNEYTEYCKGIIELRRTKQSFIKISKNRPWWSFKPEKKLILNEIPLIREFMKDLLFEIPDYQILLYFVM